MAPSRPLFDAGTDQGMLNIIRVNSSPYGEGVDNVEIRAIALIVTLLASPF